MLLVLKRTVSMRRFFWSPKTYAKTDKWENIYIWTLKNTNWMEIYITLKRGVKENN